MRCFECDSENNIIRHHVVPQSVGGIRTVPLCQVCHDKVHGIKPRNISISELTKRGLSKAKMNGVKLGNPNIRKISTQGLNARQIKGEQFRRNIKPLILSLLASGMTITDVADHLNKLNYKTVNNKPWSRVTVSYIVNN